MFLSFSPVKWKAVQKGWNSNLSSMKQREPVGAKHLNCGTLFKSQYCNIIIFRILLLLLQYYFRNIAITLQCCNIFKVILLFQWIFPTCKDSRLAAVFSLSAGALRCWKGTAPLSTPKANSGSSVPWTDSTTHIHREEWPNTAQLATTNYGMCIHPPGACSKVYKGSTQQSMWLPPPERSFWWSGFSHSDTSSDNALTHWKTRWELPLHSKASSSLLTS